VFDIFSYAAVDSSSPSLLVGLMCTNTSACWAFGLAWWALSFLSTVPHHMHYTTVFCSAGNRDQRRET